MILGMRSFLLVALLAWSAPAHAQTAWLDWRVQDGAEGCISEEQLRVRVEAELGHAPRDVVVGGTVAREEGRFVAELHRLHGATPVGRRRLESRAPSCDTLGDAVVLAMSLALAREEEAAARQPPRESVELPPPDFLSAASEGAPTAQLAQSPPRRELRARLSVVGAVDLVPGVGAGVELSVLGEVIGPLGWTASVQYLPETSAGVNADFGIGLFAASAGACLWATPQRWLVLGGCVEGMVGAVHVVVHAPVPSDPGERVWGGARGSGQVSVRPIPELGFTLAADAVVPFVRHGFLVEGRDAPEFRQLPVAPALRLGVDVGFP